MSVPIRTENLTKNFNGFRAVDSLNIEVNKALKIIDHFQSKYGAPLHDKLLQEG